MLEGLLLSDAKLSVQTQVLHIQVLTGDCLFAQLLVVNDAVLCRSIILPFLLAEVDFSVWE